MKKIRGKKISPYWHASGDSVLYNECVFPGGEGDEDTIYTDRGIVSDAGGDGGKCGVCEDDGVVLLIVLRVIGSIMKKLEFLPETFTEKMIHGIPSLTSCLYVVT